jgi:hypothetical protein
MLLLSVRGERQGGYRGAQRRREPFEWPRARRRPLDPATSPFAERPVGPRSWPAATALAFAALAVCADVAGAGFQGSPSANDVIACRRAINEEVGSYVKQVQKTLDKCKWRSMTRNDPPQQPGFANCRLDTLKAEPRNAFGTRLLRAASRLKATIAKACGGRDGTCGTGLGDDGDLPLAAINWDIGTCMNLEDGSFGHCVNEIHDCTDVGDCLACVIDVGLEQAVDGLLYDRFNPASFFPNNAAEPGRSRLKCVATIAEEGQRFLLAKQKILGKCWDRKLARDFAAVSQAEVCPDADLSGASVAKIQRAAWKATARICRKCGGGNDADRDNLCDAVLAPVRGLPMDVPDLFETPFACPALVVPLNELHDGSEAVAWPAGRSCGLIGGGAVTTLQQVIDCIACVLELKAECLSFAALGGGSAGASENMSYPAECNACVAEVDGDPCPATLEITSIATAADFDIGWTGHLHDFDVPTNGRITLTVSNCDGSSRPTCGECDLNGPIPNRGGEPFDNRRCGGNDTHVQCTTDQDCIDAGASTSCSFFFAPPLPLSSGGVPVCVTNEIVGAVTGTANIETGESEALVKLISRVHVGLTVARPCPNCENGVCTGGPRTGQPCTVSGASSIFGDLSYDCPPSAGGNIGTLRLTLPFSTGAQARTLSAANPVCRAVGFSNSRCLCDTCATAEGEACATDADCSGVCDMGTCAGGPLDGQSCTIDADCERVCGGRRCLGGVNPGAPCSAGADCPGGGECAVPGVPTSPNACDDLMCMPSTAPDDSVGEGVCAAGPVDSLCSIERFRGCLADADCTPPPAGSCNDCIPGQTCVTDQSARRRCFTDNGMIGGTVLVAGEADPACRAQAAPTLGALFCVPPTGSRSVNAMAGLPGLARLTLPAITVFDP